MTANRRAFLGMFGRTVAVAAVPAVATAAAPAAPKKLGPPTPEEYVNAAEALGDRVVAAPDCGGYWEYTGDRYDEETVIARIRLRRRVDWNDPTWGARVGDYCRTTGRIEDPWPKPRSTAQLDEPVQS